MWLRDLFRWGEYPDVVSDDPFDHPEIRRMSMREIADLPWPRPGRVLPAVVAGASDREGPPEPDARAA